MFMVIKMEKLVITQHFLVKLLAKFNYRMECKGASPDRFDLYAWGGGFKVTVKRGCVIEVYSNEKLVLWAKATVSKLTMVVHDHNFDTIAEEIRDSVNHVWQCLEGDISSDEVYFSDEYLSFHAPKDRYFPTGTWTSSGRQILLQTKTLFFGDVVNFSRVQRVSVPVKARKWGYKYIVLDTED